MVTFRNNNRRSNFRRNDRGFKNNNSDKTKFTNNLNGITKIFQEKMVQETMLMHQNFLKNIQI